MTADQATPSRHNDEDIVQHGNETNKIHEQSRLERKAYHLNTCDVPSVHKRKLNCCCSGISAN